MGRNKTTPKRFSEDVQSIYEYRPICKKRKINRSLDVQKYFTTTTSTDSNKQYFLGMIGIGKTQNVFPNTYNSCKVCFKCSEDGMEQDVLILNIDDTHVIIQATEDLSLLKELICSKIFALDFHAKCDEVFINIYLHSLPISNFSSRKGNALKSTFHRLLGFKNYTASGDSKSKYKKRLHGHQEIYKLYDKLLDLRETKFTPVDVAVQNLGLRPVLRPYQLKAVQWMLHRENMNDSDNDTLHPLYTPVQLQSGITIYYDKYNGCALLEKPTVGKITKGGILADEMGLGKTVEVLACVLANPFPNETKIDYSDSQDNSLKEEEIEEANFDEENEHIKEEIENAEKRDIEKEDITSEERRDIKTKESEDTLQVQGNKVAKNRFANYPSLLKWYHESLAEMSVANRGSGLTKSSLLIQCICGRTTRTNLVQCTLCNKWQHKTCLAYVNELKNGAYFCPQCWIEKPVIDSKGTLIVTPISLRNQWCKEIENHVERDVKVFVYEGFSSTPIYPTTLQSYDIVITTYNVLQNELRLTENHETKNFRRERRYAPPGCPLIRLKWWRLCLDEAQTVDSPTTKVSEMAGKISAEHRWAVTGTPISKNISDLFGLFDYLKITPYNDLETWNRILYTPYLNGYEKPMLEFLSTVLWRTAKKNVHDQINIPKQTVNEHILEFSAVEKYFYKREHEMSATSFLSNVAKYDPSIQLQDLDKKVLNKILIPLSSLRITCSHPNTVRGKYLATKKQVSSMKDLLEALILKNRSDSEECLRVIASSLNGLAGIHLLMRDYQQAIEFYREVLQMWAKFSNDTAETKLSVDKLLVIHALHNLAEVLETHQPNQPTLRDSTLRSDCSKLEKDYMNKFISETTSAYESFYACTISLENLRNKTVLKEGQWYSDGISWIFVNDYFKELIDKIYTAAENANVKCDVSMETERSLMRIIYLWYNDVIGLRVELFEAIKSLYKKPNTTDRRIFIKENIVEKATECHLRPNKKLKIKQKKCPVCMANIKLKKYEGTLYNMTQRTKQFEEMSLQGSWKPTLQELIFKSVLSVLKSKNPASSLVEDGETNIKIIDGLKKEFKDLRRFWTYLDQQICAEDELDICKIRLQIKPTNNEENASPSKPTILKNLSYTMENKHETVHMLSVHELDYQDTFLRSELTLTKDKLEKLLGTQNYLDTLRKQQYEGESPDPCPICKNPLEQHWSILLCGHSYCLECIQSLLEKTAGDYIQCSICRNKQKYHDISYIKYGNTVKDEDSEVEVKGNYSTKIGSIIKLLLKLKAENPGVKVLLFSFWTSILKQLLEALITNGIRCELLQSGTVEKKIKNFKDPNERITVLLLPINLGSKGLNLIEATHVILVEPLLNPADELQAVGRIHRIGQTKPTFVHKFLIKDTIEENIHQATTSDAEIWDRSNVTLQNLINLFHNPEEVQTETTNRESGSESPSETETNGESSQENIEL